MRALLLSKAIDASCVSGKDVAEAFAGFTKFQPGEHHYPTIASTIKISIGGHVTAATDVIGRSHALRTPGRPVHDIHPQK